MDIREIPAGRNPPKDINVFIEIPLGGVPVKYEFDKTSGAIFVDRFLHTAMFYPGNYGFIPHTLSDDGDPCDIIVISQVPVVPGAGRCWWHTPSTARAFDRVEGPLMHAAPRGVAQQQALPGACL